MKFNKLFVTQIFSYLKCKIRGHTISDKDKIFIIKCNRDKAIISCERCGSLLVFMMNSDISKITVRQIHSPPFKLFK